MNFSVDRQKKYMRIPFKDHGRDFSGCDCGGLVWLIYHNELHIDLPDWRDRYSKTTLEFSEDLSNTVSTMLGENGNPVPFTERKPFDVVSFRIRGADIHVGLVVDYSHFMHIWRGVTTVSIEKFTSLVWRNAVTGCYRHSTMIAEERKFERRD